MAVSVIIGTFGASRWRTLAAEAAGSVTPQEPYEVILEHADTLALARNNGAARATGDWLCFLDADDSLAPGYLAAMWAAAATSDRRTLWQPAVQYVTAGQAPPPPQLLPATNLFELNYLIIGTLISRQFFTQVGGFADWPYAEDWELWLRCHLHGACVRPMPAAVYVARVNPAGRNSVNAAAGRTYEQIRSLHAVAWAHKTKYG